MAETRTVTRMARLVAQWRKSKQNEPVTMRSGDLVLLLSGVDVAQTRRRRWYERVA